MGKFGPEIEKMRQKLTQKIHKKLYKMDLDLENFMRRRKISLLSPYHIFTHPPIPAWGGGRTWGVATSPWKLGVDMAPGICYTVRAEGMPCAPDGTDTVWRRESPDLLKRGIAAVGFLLSFGREGTRKCRMSQLTRGGNTTWLRKPPPRRPPSRSRTR